MLLGYCPFSVFWAIGVRSSFVPFGSLLTPWNFLNFARASDFVGATATRSISPASPTIFHVLIDCTWKIVGLAGLMDLVAVAPTKSEARAKFKKFHGVKRLPKGTKLERTPIAQNTENGQ